MGASTVNANQLARKGNLVVHLDASPSTYTAHPFNSDISRTGTNVSILDWPNRWNDLSGNNNHAYPCTTVNAYTSSANFPLTASYLNNNIYFNQTPANFRINPIQETTGPLSVFLWVRRKGAGSTQGQWLISKRDAGTFNQPTAYYQVTLNRPSYTITCAINNNGPTEPDTKALTTSIPNTASIGSWINIGFTVSDNTPSGIFTAYLNGVQYGSTVVGQQGMNTGSLQIVFGRQVWNAGGFADADMSQVLIYNACLTPQEVWNNYQITKYKHQT
jgi:hypothetical protein